MFGLSQFTLQQLLDCSERMEALLAERAGHDSSSMEDCAQALTRFFYEQFVNPQTGERECALVRFYKTHPFADLPPDIRGFVRAHSKDRQPEQETPCLTLLGTAGERPEWNDSARSVDHQSIPLLSLETVEEAPMIAHLFRSFGVEPNAVLASNADLLLVNGKKIYNVFHVAQAEGSSCIPAQREFVRPYGVQSVVGFGGPLPSGSLFAVILFSKAPIDRKRAEFFRYLAITLRGKLLPLDRGRTFVK